MDKERILSVPLYNDLASIFFGLYENEDKYRQYTLLVVNVYQAPSGCDYTVFSSNDDVFLDGVKFDTMDWLASNSVLDYMHNAKLKYIPNISTYSLPNNLRQNQVEDYLIKVFNREIVCDTMVFENSSSIWINNNYITFMFLYKNNLLDTILPIVSSSCEKVLDVWREYFRSGKRDMQVPLISLGTIVEHSFEDPEASFLFSTITKISSLYYESTRCDGSIAITQNCDNANQCCFIDNLPFSDDYAKQLRKLLETAKKGFSMLVRNNFAYGIGEPISTRYLFKITGHLEWMILNDEMKPLLRYKYGDYYVPLSIEMDWYIKYRTPSLGIRERKLIMSVIDDVQKSKKGALFFILDDAEREVERLCIKKRGIKISPSDIRSPHTKAMTSIDGALILNKNGLCYGIGVIIDGDATVDGTPARGSRYNSAKNYVKRRYDLEMTEIYAVIISEDGYIDIITHLHTNS